MNVLKLGVGVDGGHGAAVIGRVWEEAGKADRSKIMLSLPGQVKTELNRDLE